MLKFVVIFAATICAIKAQDGARKPNSDSKACNIDYLKELELCVKAPQLIGEEDFQACVPKVAKTGKKSGRVAGKKGGKKSSSQRSPGQAGKMEKAQIFTEDNVHCDLDCVFNTAKLLDSTGNVNTTAAHTVFKRRAPKAPWKNIIKDIIDSCSSQIKNAILPSKKCNQQSLIFSQCLYRALFIYAPDNERTATAVCDARLSQLQYCDPMVHGFMAKIQEPKSGKIKGRKGKKSLRLKKNPSSA